MVMGLKPRISIVCSNALQREGLRRILVAQDFEVEAVASDGRDVPLAKDDGTISIVIVADGSDEASLAICRDVHERSPASRILILGHDTKSRLVAAAFQAGSDGYVSDEISTASLARVLDLIALGEKVVPSQIVYDLPLFLHDKAGSQDALDLGKAQLSDREIDILRGLAQGDPNKVISRDLGISEPTVKIHVKSILRKLKVLNRTQAAIWGVSRGLSIVPRGDGDGD